MFERFSERARRVIVLAQGEARSLGHAHIGTEHLLLGLLREGDSPAVVVLEALGVSGERVLAQVEEVIGSRGPGSPQHIAFTPRVKKVLELSLIESRRLGHPVVGPEHLLLGLVAEDEGTGAQILTASGASLGRVREQVAAMGLPDEELLEPEPGPQPVETPADPLAQRLDRIEQTLARMADTLEAVLRRLDDRS
ncbi:MAG: Clp protease N-terminal domain-containing protein [Nocardioidaceae bacterium]